MICNCYAGTSFYDSVLSTLDAVKVLWFPAVSWRRRLIVLQTFAAFGKDLERQRHVVIAVRTQIESSI
jgi:hypothetical protein